MGKALSVEEKLKALTARLNNFPSQVRFDTVGLKPSQDMEPFERILYASQALLSGALPNADTLAFIALALDKYITSEGELSLDEAFRLKSKPRAGNPSRQYTRQNEKNSKLFDMAWLRAADPRLTIEAAAAEVCAHDPELNEVGDLKRSYSRGKWKAVEDALKGK